MEKINMSILSNREKANTIQATKFTEMPFNTARHNFEEICGMADNLPTLPGIALKMLDAVQKDNPDINEIGDIISNDPALSAKVLKMINSSFYSIPTQITSVNHAIKLLGIQAVQNLALSFSLVRKYKPNKATEFDYTQFWKNSLVGAISAKLLAEKLDPGFSEEIFFLALLQNIGTLTLGHSFPDKFSLVRKAMELDGLSLQTAESQILGYSHQEIGEYLAKSWGLPDNFYIPIGYHHGPDNMPSKQTNIQTSAQILYLSSLIIELLDANNAHLNLWLLEDTLEKYFPSNDVDVDSIVNEICEQTQQIFPLFEIDLDQHDYIQLLETARAELSKISTDMIKEMLEQTQEISTLKKEVTRDSMTRLYNHEYFRELLQKEISRSERYYRPLSLIIADIDHFKLINDTYGHLSGDRVIKSIAALLNAEVRDSDFVARYGGEEFAIIVTETEPNDAIRTAERMRKIIESLNFIDESGVISATMSFGVASLAVGKKTNIDELIKQADRALYEAKENGRNRCCLFRQ